MILMLKKRNLNKNMYYIFVKNLEYKITQIGDRLYELYLKEGWNIFSGPYKTHAEALMHVP